MRPTHLAAAPAGALALALLTSAAVHAVSGAQSRWTPQERDRLRALSLTSLGPLPADPSNRYADDSAAARLGHRLFFDTRLSATGEVSCASCHVPNQDFQDGRPRGVGVGTAARRTMPVAGTAYGAWQFWDGRADSQWGQALGPLESAVEHGGDRTQYAQLVAAEYRREYEAVFGPLPARRSRASTRTSARRSPRTSGASASRRRASTATWTPSWRAGRTRPKAPSRATRRPGCGCSSARRAASTATTGRC